MSRNPPPKKKGDLKGTPRKYDGELLDVRHVAEFLGTTEKTIWARVARRTIPFRRFGGRVLFSRTELLGFIEKLEGCTASEALENLEGRMP